VISRPTARFEKFFLTPLSFILPVVAGVNLFHKDWYVGGYFILAWIWSAMLGQSLHPDKNTDQLKAGGLTDESNVRRDDLISQEEYRRLARKIFFVGLMLGISTAVLMSHNDFMWFVSVSSGIGVWIVSVFAISAITIWRTK
jgi:hypothetical protein